MKYYYYIDNDNVLVIVQEIPRYILLHKCADMGLDQIRSYWARIPKRNGRVCHSAYQWLLYGNYRIIKDIFSGGRTARALSADLLEDSECLWTEL
jgi:hypothetical protein